MARATLLLAVLLAAIPFTQALTGEAAQAAAEAIRASSAVESSEAKVQTYDVSIPQEWQSLISVGNLSVVGPAFYGVPWNFGLFPVVRLRFPLKNLTTEPLYLPVNYSTESEREGYGNTGMGVYYKLEPGEERVIDTIVPIASIKRLMRFKLRMERPDQGAPNLQARANRNVLTIGSFSVPVPPELPSERIVMTVQNEERFSVNVRLEHSEGKGNLFVVRALNKTDRELLLGVYVGVNDPENIHKQPSPLARERGFFSSSFVRIPAGRSTDIPLDYAIPQVGANPLLVFTVFEPPEGYAQGDEGSTRRWDVALVACGAAGLKGAAKRGECVIPPFVPVEERANLTGEMETKHFVFRYRPDSYAQQHLSEIVKERDQVYDRLSGTLHMELPRRVRIDLYPDMEAGPRGHPPTQLPTFISPRSTTRPQRLTRATNSHTFSLTTSLAILGW